MLMRPLCILVFALFPLLFASAAPNVLIIMADDCTFSDLPVYGGHNALTPNIDRLAGEGLVFNKAYLTSAMCQPCRAELYTGQYPMRNGCAWNHSASRNDTKSLPHHLERLGYRVGIAGKVHVQPATAFPFENVGGFDKSCTRAPTQAHDMGAVKEFISRDAKQPFCLTIALVDPHVPWVMGDASQYKPKKLKLPPHLADTEMTREDFSRYLAEITYMDGQVGEILTALEASGKSQDTLVLFTSEQGSQFPGCKWTQWDVGVHTAMIARWPGKVAAGERTDAIIQYCDVVPTVIELAGGDPAKSPVRLDGRSFAKVLSGEAMKHREFAFGTHNNIPEGPSYPVRTVTDGEYRYIRNLLPDEIYIEKHLMGYDGTKPLTNAYWATWVAEAWNNPATYNLVKRYTHRPAEEFYHTAYDPGEMTNLASDPKYAEMKAKLSSELDRWLEEQGDPGVPQDTHEAHVAAKKGQHLYFPKD
ncbi:MAG: sulfatase [Verrucomicrobiaceae bacterium]|nr:sulfatase [Verrucomicrobiaceae bacterium]